MRPTTLIYTSCIVGFMCILYAATATVLRYNPHRLTFAGYMPPSTQDVQEVRPTRVVIESANIDVPISEAEYTNTWALSSQGASHLSSSPIPGARGNSIVYGHNWSSIFARLVTVRPGDTIRIHLSDKTLVSFVVEAVDVVSQDATEVLKNTQDTRLTLYTCTGLFDQDRFVVTAVHKN